MATDEIMILFKTDDVALADDLRRDVPEAEVSDSNNFGGGASEIAVFVKPAVDVLKSIFGFLSARKIKPGTGKLKFSNDTFEIEGFTVEEIERLMENPAFSNALESRS